MEKEAAQDVRRLAFKAEHDVVQKPSHYQSVTIDGHHIQVVDVIEAFIPYNAHLAHTLTYLLRAGYKEDNDEIQELRKAIWWIERRIKFLQSQELPGDGLDPHYDPREPLEVRNERK